jgi:hypothetical protein
MMVLNTKKAIDKNQWLKVKNHLEQQTNHHESSCCTKPSAERQSVYGDSILSFLTKFNSVKVFQRYFVSSLSKTFFKTLKTGRLSPSPIFG